LAKLSGLKTTIKRRFKGGRNGKDSKVLENGDAGVKTG